MDIRFTFLGVSTVEEVMNRRLDGWTQDQRRAEAHWPIFDQVADETLQTRAPRHTFASRTAAVMTSIAARLRSLRGPRESCDDAACRGPVGNAAG